MSVLTLTFQDGTTSEFPFHTGSQLSVTTPDGVNGDRYGSWGEIVDLTLGDTPEPQPVETRRGSPIEAAPDDTDGVSTYSAIALLEEQPKSDPPAA